MIAASFTPARVNETSHLLRLEIGRLFVHEGNEAQSLPGRLSGKTAGEREQGGDPAAVVICAGGAEDRIIMCADDSDLRTNARNFRFDVVAGLSV